MGQSFDCGMVTPPSLDALSSCWSPESIPGLWYILQGPP
uniref:Uncharacterized protein n=1 Tax=Trichinella nativa TaxID=6335 RepID=A0A0V1KHY1_9BILA